MTDVICENLDLIDRKKAIMSMTFLDVYKLLDEIAEKNNRIITIKLKKKP